MSLRKCSIEISFATPLCIVQAPPGTPCGKGYKGIFTLKLGVYTVTGENMANTMPLNSYATVSVQWVDAAGNPAPVDGPTTWQSSDPAVADCVVATGNPLIANIHSLAIGPVQIQATADADMGGGVKTITAMLDLSVIAGEAVGGTLSMGTPTTGPSSAPPPSSTKK